MSDFSVRVDSLASLARTSLHTANCMKAIRMDIRTIEWNLSGDSFGSAGVLRNLQRLSQMVDAESIRMQEISSAAYEIADLYSRTEKLLAGENERYAENIENAASEETGVVFSCLMSNNFSEKDSESSGRSVRAQAGAAADLCSLEFVSEHADVKAAVGRADASACVFASSGNDPEKGIYVAAQTGACARASLLYGSAALEAGNDFLGGSINAEGAAGSAEVSGKAEFSYNGEDGLTAKAGGKLMVSAVSGGADGDVNLGLIKVHLGVSGYAGAAGVEGSAGIEDHMFMVSGGAALGVGGGIEAGIGLSDGAQGMVDGFIDAVSDTAEAVWVEVRNTASDIAGTWNGIF